jgi:EAL domain-containing protein (putative c-di-GMP-specific phosphodiesterase class I)
MKSAWKSIFNPIASIRRRNVVGVRSAVPRLMTAMAPSRPAKLFAAAHDQGASAALDHACQSEALRRFAPLPTEGGKRDDQLILFVNVHPASVESEGFVSQLLERVQNEGLEPRRVVVELLEVEMREAVARRAAHQLREAGFLVALDDIGAGSSNLDRIAMVRPDILKADSALVSGLDTDYHQREVFKSLVNLSEKIGGWIIAEGVETLSEALTVLDLGGDFMQGYFLARPSLLKSVAQLEPSARRRANSSRDCSKACATTAKFTMIASTFCARCAAPSKAVRRMSSRRDCVRF